MRTQHGPCPNCLRQKSRIVSGEEVPVDCKSCIAETLIRGVTKRGILTEEQAKGHCLCFATGHTGIHNTKPSDSYHKVLEQYRKLTKKEEEEKASIVFQGDIEKEKEQEYYKERKEQLKLMDKENGGVWMGDNNE